MAGLTCGKAGVGWRLDLLDSTELVLLDHLQDAQPGPCQWRLGGVETGGTPEVSVSHGVWGGGQIIQLKACYILKETDTEMEHHPKIGQKLRVMNFTKALNHYC